MPAIGPSAVVEAPRRCGATAVFADVEAPDRPWISAADVAEQRITKRTRAVIAVHSTASWPTSTRCARSATPTA